MSIKTIRVCAGIGDNIWLIQKLLSTKEKFNFLVAGDEPKRGKQIFEYLPQLVNNVEYGTHTSEECINNNIFLGVKSWRDISRNDNFFLSCNHHLESGKRIESFLSDLPVTYRINYETAHCKAEADALLPNDGREYIGLYGSCYSVLRHWHFWKEREWVDLANRLNSTDKKFTFVVIGASFDMDLGRNMIRELRRHNIEVVDTIGQNLGVVMEIMKRLKYFFAFPSGLGILSTSMGVPTTMFYPEHLKFMINTWADPKMIVDNTYKGCQFCTPEQIYNWVKGTYKIYDR